MQKWYVIKVLSGQEKKVKRLLEEHREKEKLHELIEEILLPTENVSEVKGGEQRVTERRVWPGYLLLRMNLTDEIWQLVKNTNGVIDFIGGEEPSPLSEEEAATLADLKANKERITTKHPFKTDDRVKIVDGAFQNFTGTVTQVFHDKGRLNVLVSIFGREVQVEDLEFWQVEQAAEES